VERVEPIELTPGAGQLETLGLSADGKTLYYAKTTRRRRIARAIYGMVRRRRWQRRADHPRGDDSRCNPGSARVGQTIAVLRQRRRAASSASIPAANWSTTKVVYPTLGRLFQPAAHVAPSALVLKADDGMGSNTQLFLRRISSRVRSGRRSSSCMADPFVK